MIGMRLNVRENNLPRFSSRIRGNVASAMRNGMLNFNRIVNPPVDTSFLTGNRSHVFPSANFFGGLKGKTTFNAPYAGYVHDGFTHYLSGKKVAAQPYADDAIDIIRDDYLDAIRRATEDAAS